jgi:Bacteriocin-protection, YdeI or OmpD-Associated/Domain of unknown function (DUF1905)
MIAYPYSFEGEIERFGVGKGRVIWYQVLMLPQHLRAELPFDQHPRLRVKGEIADVPVEGAWMPTGDGRNYFIVGPHVRKQTDAKLGMRAEMRFRVDNQDRVDVPEALARALASSHRRQKLWDALTPGKQRGLCHLVRMAKSEATQAKRIKDVLKQLET